jgi:hypothetical protein
MCVNNAECVGFFRGSVKDLVKLQRENRFGRVAEHRREGAVCERSESRKPVENHQRGQILQGVQRRFAGPPYLSPFHSGTIPIPSRYENSWLKR